MSGVTHIIINEDEDGMRLDRWFKNNYPTLGFGQLQKLLRSGQIRLDGKRIKTGMRLIKGQTIRLPPMVNDQSPKPPTRDYSERISQPDRDFMHSLILHEDDVLIVINKPPGLASQGGSKTTRHIDGLLSAFGEGESRPKLVHRLDRDTSGVLLLAKTRHAAAKLGGAFRAKATRKIYWALTVGVPRPHQGEISAFLKKQSKTNDPAQSGPQSRIRGERVEVVGQGEPGAQHSHSHYALIEQAAQKLAWVALAPTTGRTHQLRVHMAELGTPILGDPKYFNLPEWHEIDGLAKGLHLHAQKLIIPHPSGGSLDVSAPLPDHMRASFQRLGLDPATYNSQWEQEL